MATNNDWGLRPSDLPWSQPISEQAATSVSTPKGWDNIIWFDVFSSVEKEQKQAQRDVAKDMRELLKKRASARTELLKSNTDWWKRNARTSELVDWAIQILNDMWASPQELEQYTTSKGGLEMINNLKLVDNGRYSWEIENYLNWNSPYTYNQLMSQIFPDYMEKYWYSDWTLEAWSLTPWQKFMWWTNTNEAARTTKRILKWASNLVLWAANELAEFTLWFGDFINNIVQDAALQSPDSYLKDLTSKKWQERYQQVVDAGKYNWTYEQWVNEAYDKYASLYDKTMSEPWVKEQYETWRDTNKLNWYDEDAPMTQVWEWWTKIGEWFGMDAVMKDALKLIRAWYKWYKWLKAAQALRGTTAVWDADIIAAWSSDDIFRALSSKTERELAWNMFTKLSEAFAKSISDWTPNTLSRILEWSRIWMEMQALDDIHEWELSSPAAYAFSALFNSVFNVTLGTIWDIIGKAITPNDLIKRSLSRVDAQTIDKYTTMAQRASTDARLEHPLAYVTKKATNTAAKKVENALKSEWAKLWNIRKNMPETNLQISDAIEKINEGFSKNNMGVRIVWNAEEWFRVEWVISSSDKAIEWIVNKLNSMLSEVKFKAQEWAKVPTNTEAFENFYTSLKRIWWNAEKQDKPMFQEIENSVREYLDNAIWKEYAGKYADALASNAELYGVQDALKELPSYLKDIDKAEWWGQNLLSNWMTLNELLDHLEKKWFAPNLIDEREIAWYLQSYYKVPITNWDRVMYPSPSWALQEAQKITLRAFQNPRWNAALRHATPTSKHIWRPISSYWKWYQPSKLETARSTIWDAINKAVWGEWAVMLSEAINED